jgi:undecaprenyl-diphosphatase
VTTTSEDVRIIRVVSPSRRDRLIVASAAGAFLAGARLARRPEMSPWERRWFGVLNHLSGPPFVLVWTVMQFGSLGGAITSGIAAAAAGRRRAARLIIATGAITWASAKAAKPFVGRKRPSAVAGAARILGREQSGLGYPSGHAAVATAVAVVGIPELPPAWRRPAWLVALTVGPARTYVGAHLPLDVLGGVAFGLMVGTAARHVTDRA